MIDQPGGDQRVGLFTYQLIADVVVGHVPGTPSHRWREREFIADDDGECSARCAKGVSRNQLHTGSYPACCTMPVMMPVFPLIVNPGGRPFAENFIGRLPVAGMM